ncbi:ATP-binding protein [Bradyrhizobium cosmicum]|uniref:sensor histidine kinase n=1 Tax=Bradyrhizobium cosmicum TaxID=1404864 RepID=UPI001165169A|nr:ATP-binding protein [Bradyrhizobium cosmicum]QDP26193.1 GHKL domain-containing protein [Bradyrhizobium cosmicum]
MCFWPTALSWRNCRARSFTAVLAIALLQVTVRQSQAADPAAKRVLMLHSFGPQFKPWSDYARTIRAEIIRQVKSSIDFTDFSLTSARSDNAEPEIPLVQYLRALYLREPLDLIIAVGAPAASFIQRHRSELFQTTPMIFTAVDRRRVDFSQLSENDTVVAVDHDFAAILKTILQVLPDTKALAIVNGVSPNEVFWHAEIQRQLAPFANRVVLKWYDELPFADILKDAAKLPPHSAILWHLMNVDAASVSHEENEALNALASVASAPIFSYDGSFFEGALVGGPMFSVLESSAITASVANRILSGERAGDIKTRPIEFAAAKFDWRQMQRWGISENNLPAGSTVYFREPTVWERYAWQIASVVAILVIQAGFIIILLREHRRRQLVEVQYRQRTAELVHVNRIATAGELTASIAHEINQPLGAILTNAETAQVILKSPSPDMAELNEIVGDILRDDRRASEVIRRMKSLLKKAPFELKSLDFNDLVGETVELVLGVGRKVELVSVITPEALLILGDRIQLQQVILNLVTNGIDAMKEIPTENRIISIRTARVEKFAELSVSDRGPGIPEDKLKEVFDPFYSSKADGMGMGLSIARTIIEAHNGQIRAENRDHGGASFRIRLPIVQ